MSQCTRYTGTAHENEIVVCKLHKQHTTNLKNNTKYKNKKFEKYRNKYMSRTIQKYRSQQMNIVQNGIYAQYGVHKCRSFKSTVKCL